MIYLETERLLLREWLPSDLHAFTQMNQDPRVMEFMLQPVTEAQSALMIEKFQRDIASNGFGLFACTLKQSGAFIGAVGLNIPAFEAPFMPAVEIAWRLVYQAWNQGYATEAAQAVLETGFNQHALKEIVAITVPANMRSRRVMEKIGLVHDCNGDFNHPKIPSDHPLQLHVLYRLTVEDYYKASERILRGEKVR